MALGGTPIGAPIIGWVADKFGARWALGIAAAAGFAAALVAVHYLAKQDRLSPKRLLADQAGGNPMLQAPNPPYPQSKP
jgi:MFS family permease